MYGGTFNPLHNGHIGIVQYTKQSIGLDEVYFIPASVPPHKSSKNLASAQERYDMVRKSVKGFEGFFVSDVELKRKGPSFTIDTINEFTKDFPSDVQFYLLMGSDAFLDISTWEKKDNIFESVSVIVMLRGNWKEYDIIAAFIADNISKGYTLNQKKMQYSHMNKKDIIICEVPRIEISSTMIRNYIQRNQSITDLVPDPVARIIKTTELYR